MRNRETQAGPDSARHKPFGVQSLTSVVAGCDESCRMRTNPRRSIVPVADLNAGRSRAKLGRSM